SRKPTGFLPRATRPLPRSFLWKSKACGLSPQGYSPWTSLNNRLVALDTVRSFVRHGGLVERLSQRERVWGPEHSIGGPARSRASSPGEKARRLSTSKKLNEDPLEVVTMKHSTDRILTTHVGSLPRPPAVLEVLADKESGQAYDRALWEE